MGAISEYGPNLSPALGMKFICYPNRARATPKRVRRARYPRNDMAFEFTTSFHKESLESFRAYKRYAERAIEQLSDEDLFRVASPGGNSIAIIVKHMTGNMRSRFTNFLTEDGEKPWRNRDTEFEAPLSTREALLQDWEDGWAVVFRELGALTDGDMACTVTVRGDPHSIMQAILRQVAHYAQHVGQIVLLAKQYKGDEWISPSIPRGQSEAFNRRVKAGEIPQR